MKSTKTTLKHLFLSFIIVFSLASCRTSIDFGRENGNGTITTQSRTISEKFEQIQVSSGISLIVSQSDVTSVEVETDENIQPLIITKVENGVLIIKTDDSFDATKGPEVRVSLPFITSLKSSSGASVKNGTTLKSTSLSVDSSSGSKVVLDVEADFISLESSSGSSIEVTGKAIKAETASSSGSNINAGKLMANEVFAQTSSGSSTKVYPIISLKAKASSGSDIRYKNVPKTLEKEESSGGSISNN